MVEQRDGRRIERRVRVLGPDMALSCLGHDDPYRDVAAASLLACVAHLAERCLHGELARFRDDVVGDVVEKAMRNAPLEVAGQGDTACRRYLRVMIKNRALTLLRPERREAAARFLAPPTGELPESPHESLRLLHQLFERMLETRQRRYHDGMRRAFAQLCDLLVGLREMDDVLREDEGVERQGPEVELRRARDRVLQNHSRLRRQLEETLARELRAGRLAPEEGREVGRALLSLFRCQSVSRGRVPG